MPYFVNLPLIWVAQEPTWLNWFLAAGIAPELGLDNKALRQPLAWHKGIVDRLRDAGLPVAVHLPFLGLRPGDIHEGERKKAWDVLRMAADRAALYNARHIIGHHGFIAAQDGLKRSSHEPDPDWVKRTIALWRELPERSGALLFLENSHEHGPGIVLSLVKAAQNSQVGVCFDAGHWHSFAEGGKRKNLADWIDALAPYLRHLHLHDNDGTGDQHLGLGQGCLPFTLLLSLLSSHRLSPTLTFEPHTVKDFLATAAWFEEHPGPAQAWGWHPPHPPTPASDYVNFAQIPHKN